jgi:hypothetical protein
MNVPAVWPAVVLLAASTAQAQPVVDPPSVRLSGPAAAYSLLVHGRDADLTPIARFRSLTPAVAVVEGNVVRAVADGTGAVEVEAGGRTMRVDVTVEGSARSRTYHFENDIEPVFGRFGCNSSGCHGKAEGQNGFKLSVFGFDPAGDYAALTSEARGRRVFPAAPEQSLLLTKSTGRVAHGGGMRLRVGDPAYELLRGWIAAGMPVGDPAAPRVESIRVEPRERVLAMRGRQQLRVVARYTDGREADVTSQARFQVNNEGLAHVGADGLVSAFDAPGEVAIMAGFLGAVDTFRAIIPRAGQLPDRPALPQFNFIDKFVDAKLAKLNVQPSDVCSDEEFLRRAFLDVIGKLATPAEARAFLADQRPDKRTKLVDALLDRPEYAELWALHWADVLRIDAAVLGRPNAYAYYRWLRTSLAAGKPIDRMARELVTAEGPLAEVGPANFYKAAPKPGEAASSLAQVLLGVRIGCAECHHHPYDRWTQTDYYGMQAFFAPLQVKRTADGEALLAAGDPVTKHPRTGEVVAAHALGTPMPRANPAGDRRRELADWLTAADNPYFARNTANRVWAQLLGRGLVEPVDDVRATNPPSNPELLDALAAHFVAEKYDVRQLIRTITASRAYQTSSRPNETNARDEQNFSRALFKRVPAEVLLDMVCQATGVSEKFSGAPAGTRAVQLWDSKVPHYFLKAFGRPVRASACECERQHEPSVAQVLHLLNAPEIQAKLAHESGTVARLAGIADDGKIVEELYITFYSRLPADGERKTATDYLASHKANRRQAVEDLTWGLLNSLEFIFNH